MAGSPAFNLRDGITSVTSFSIHIGGEIIRKCDGYALASEYLHCDVMPVIYQRHRGGMSTSGNGKALWDHLYMSKVTIPFSFHAYDKADSSSDKIKVSKPVPCSRSIVQDVFALLFRS